MKYLLTLLVPLCIFTSCHHDNGSDDNTPADRTVIVYMVAENTLSNYAKPNIDSMVVGSKSISSKNNLIVYVDSADKSGNKPCIMRLSGGKKEIVKQYDTDPISSDPAQMSSALKWIIDKYPATSYGLVLWSHASGWLMEDSLAYAGAKRRRAFGVDNGMNSSGTNNGNWINIPSLAKLLSTMPKFEFIFSDCCNMQSIEVAYELRNVCNHLIGSPAEIPGNGAPYRLVVPDMFKTSGYADAIISDYFNTYSSNLSQSIPNESVMLSDIKTEGINDFASLTRTYIAKIMNDKGIYPNSPSMTGIPYYYRYSTVFALDYDMKGFMYEHLNSTDFATWLSAFNAQVPIQKLCSTWLTSFYALESHFGDFAVTTNTAGAVSMFVPLSIYSGQTGNENYNANIKKMQWYYAARWSDFGW